MKLKNILLTGLSMVLVATIAIGGTVAYLTSEDSDVNVMTLGNVKIEQHEYERAVDADGNFVTNENGYVLTDFTQAKPLLPATGAVTDWDKKVVPFDQIGGEGNMQVLDGINNVQDKFVVVENTGKTDAYVRTIIAFESGSKTADEWKALVMKCTHTFWSYDIIGVANIDGNNYVITELVYDRVLEAGAVSRSSLSQIYLKPVATNEDCEALDGNDNGTYDILVFSQAVQTAGFSDATTALDAAFGDITTTNHPWAGEGNEPEIPVVVANADELTEAVAAGKSVALTADVALTTTLTVSEDAKITIDLNGNKLSGAIEGREAVIMNNGTLTVKGGTVASTVDNGGYVIHNKGVLTVEDAELIGAPWNTGKTNPESYPRYVVNNVGTATISNTTVTANHGGVATNSATAKTTLNNVDITVGTKNASSHGVYAIGGTTVINGGSINVNDDAHSSCNTVYYDADVANVTIGTDVQLNKQPGTY